MSAEGNGEPGPTVEEAARMAAHVYHIDKDGTNPVELINGWELQNPLSDGSLLMGVYKRKLDDGSYEYAIANAGTADGEDWKQNLKQLARMSDDVDRSKELAVYYDALYNDSHLTFIGHSKGGAEAAANALVSEDRDAIIFNPAWLSSHDYIEYGSKYTGTITSYVVAGEPLDLVQTLSLSDNTVLQKPTNTVYLPFQTWQPIDNHGMGAVIEGVDEWRNGRTIDWKREFY